MIGPGSTNCLSQANELVKDNDLIELTSFWSDDKMHHFRGCWFMWQLCHRLNQSFYRSNRIWSMNINDRSWTIVFVLISIKFFIEIFYEHLIMKFPFLALFLWSIDYVVTKQFDLFYDMLIYIQKLSNHVE